MKRQDYLDWNNYFMEMAKLTARRSKDPCCQVGCCICDPETHNILAIGYNGLPIGFNDDEFPWEKDKTNFVSDKNSYVVHAEANAILNASASIKGATVYVTMFPCNECAKLLAQRRVGKVVYLDDRYKSKPTGEVSLKILETAGIVVEEFKK